MENFHENVRLLIEKKAIQKKDGKVILKKVLKKKKLTQKDLFIKK